MHYNMFVFLFYWYSLYFNYFITNILIWENNIRMDLKEMSINTRFNAIFTRALQ